MLINDNLVLVLPGDICFTNFRIMELEVGRNLLNITSNNTNPNICKSRSTITVHLTLDYFDHVRSALYGVFGLVISIISINPILLKLAAG